MPSSSLKTAARAALLAGAMLAIGGPVSALAQEEVGQVTRVANFAYQTPPGASKAAAYERDPVYHDAEVEAVNEAGAELTFLDGSKLTVGPNSSVVIDDFVYDPSANAGSAALRLTKGMLRYVSGEMPDDKVRLETDTVTIGIRGTIVKAGILDDGLTVVSCVEGLCVVTSKQTGETVEVPGSWFVKADASGNLTPVQFGVWEFGEKVIDEGMLFQNGNPTNDIQEAPEQDND
jgi:hypothetical protein